MASPMLSQMSITVGSLNVGFTERFRMWTEPMNVSCSCRHKRYLAGAKLNRTHGVLAASLLGDDTRGVNAFGHYFLHPMRWPPLWQCSGLLVMPLNAPLPLPMPSPTRAVLVPAPM